jgi:hypothetical protein
VSKPSASVVELASNTPATILIIATNKELYHKLNHIFKTLIRLVSDGYRIMSN